MNVKKNKTTDEISPWIDLITGTSRKHTTCSNCKFKNLLRESNRLLRILTSVSVSCRFGHAKTIRADAYKTKTRTEIDVNNKYRIRNGLLAGKINRLFISIAGSTQR